MSTTRARTSSFPAPDLLSRSLPQEGIEYRSDKGELRLWCPGPHLVASRLTGIFAEEFVPCITHYIDRLYARNYKLVGFHDWEDVTDYESDARVQLTRWLLPIRTRIEAVHFLIRSKFGVLGLSVSNLALGGMLTPHASRVTFDRELRSAIARSGASILA